MDMTSYIIGRKSAGGGSDITIDDVIAITGELDNLDTTDKSNLVNAINEVASSSGGDAITFVDTNTFYLSGKKKGIYYLTAQPTSVYYDETYSATSSISPIDGFLYLLKDIDNTIQDGELFGLYISYNSNWIEVRLLNRDTSGLFSNIGFRQNNTRFSAQFVIANTTQTISGKKTFDTLPETSITPTTNNQLANKKYVDDAVAGAGGGDNNIYDIDINGSLSSGGGGNILVDTTQLINAVNDAYSKGYDNIVLRIFTGNNTNQVLYIVPYQKIQEKPTYLSSYFLNPLAENVGLIQIGLQWTSDEVTNITSQIWQSTRINLNSLLHTNNAETITGKKTFTTLPESNVVPANDNQFTNKKYVDDAISTEIGNINTILAKLTTPSNGGA